MCRALITLTSFNFFDSGIRVVCVAIVSLYLCCLISRHFLTMLYATSKLHWFWERLLRAWFSEELTILTNSLLIFDRILSFLCALDRIAVQLPWVLDDNIALIQIRNFKTFLTRYKNLAWVLLSLLVALACILFYRVFCVILVVWLIFTIGCWGQLLL